MLNWPSYQQQKTLDYQLFDCAECAKFLVDMCQFPAQRRRER